MCKSIISKRLFGQLFSLALIAAPLHAFAAKTIVTGESDILFGEILENAAEQIQTKYPALFSSSCEKKFIGWGYNCGEIPFGDLITGNARRDQRNAIKKLFEFTTDAEAFSSSDSDGRSSGTFPATPVKIFMTRYQSYGFPITNIKQLGDTAASPPLTNSYYLGKDIFVNLHNSNNVMIARACITIPGFTVMVPTITSVFNTHTVRYGTWKTLWMDTAGDIQVTSKAKIADIKIKGITSCAKISITPVVASATSELIVSKGPLQYKTELLEVENPRFLGVEGGAVTVTVTTTGKSFWGSIFKWIGGASIDSKIKEKLLSKFKAKVDVALTDLNKGTFAKTYLEKHFSVDFVNNLSADVKTGFVKDFSPKVTKFASLAKQRCQWIMGSLKAKLPASFAPRATEVYEYCDDFENLTLKTFQPNQASIDAKCYSDYVRLAEYDPTLKIPAWRTVKCKFSNKFSVPIEPILSKLGTCILGYVQRSNDKCEDEISGIAAEIIRGN